MTNQDLYVILSRHSGHDVRIIGTETVRLVCDDCGLIVASADKPADHFRKPIRKPVARKRGQSAAMKRFLAEKFPTHAGTSEESEYYARVGRLPIKAYDVDVTLTHGSTVIHCNDSTGLKTARQYVKGLTA